MRRLKTQSRGFQKEWRRFLEQTATISPKVERVVSRIVVAVRRQGDRALFASTRRFDRFKISKRTVRVSAAELRRAWRQLSTKEQATLKRAASRIRRFHKEQRPYDFSLQDRGARMGMRWLPLGRVGVYVPGGQAAYPSTVLMNAIPAQVAGVQEIAMVTPAPAGHSNSYVLAAAELLGISEVYRVGGAQAIAALAYGTESIAAVDKIVGPGNAYVAAAKRQVFGTVAIDMIAGPTEVLIVADGRAKPALIAADLISQAEHDAEARSVLITTSSALIEKIERRALRDQIRSLSRRELIRRALRNNGLLVLARTKREVIELANEMAPEHLELMVAQPKKWLQGIHNAGAIFLGDYSPVAAGDYAAGPNHVLPTARTARFASPLGVYDFMKGSSLLELSKKGLDRLSGDIVRLAEIEGLTAHGRSITIRKD